MMLNTCYRAYSAGEIRYAVFNMIVHPVSSSLWVNISESFANMLGLNASKIGVESYPVLVGVA